MTEDDAAALMMGDMRQLLLSSPSTDDTAQTPMSVMKRGEEGVEWKEFEGGGALALP